MTAALEKAGLAAVDRFLETWNSRNPGIWAGSLHYPHVRPSPNGPATVAQTREMYIESVDYSKVLATGWDHSEWDYRQVLHVCESRIHVAGQWSRYDADGQVILTMPIVYIVTLLEGEWGIQSRFATDFAGDETDTTELQTRGTNLIVDFVNQQNAGNKEACVEMLNFPHFSVGNGTLEKSDSAADFSLLDTNIQIESLIAVQTGQHALNAAVDLSLPNGEQRQGVIHINNRDDHLGIAAWSILNPNE